jgi:hypothetical protein
MRTTPRVLTAAASVMALALTGCDTDGGGAKVPTAGGATPTASSNGGANGALAEWVDGQRAYVKCLRENGVDAPDPDAKGKIDFGDTRVLKENPVYMKASMKCASFSLPVPEGMEESSQPKLSPEQIKTKREYAECMQKNGVPDFPEPGPDGRQRDVLWDSTSAAAKQATRTCAPIIGAPVNPGPAKG